MLLTFKDLQQKKFTVEVEPSDTIKQVKEKIADSQGYDVEAQKLIYSGKILADDQTVESYKIQEKDFVVCMVRKPKPTSTASPAKPSTPTPTVSTPSVPASAPAPQPGAVPVPNPVTPATTTATSPPPAPQPAAVPAGPAAFGDPNAFSVGGARENAIQQLMAMGFERPDVERAMRAAFNNPDRAVEYLMDGIPPHLQMEAAGGPRSPPAAVPATPSPAAPTTQPEQPQTSPTPQPTTTSTPGGPINLFEAAAQRAAAARSGGTIRPAAPNAGATPAVGAGAGAGGPGGLTAGMGANLEALRNNPNFLQLRNIVQSNPQLLEPIIQNIAQGNPQFAQLITQNPEAFLQLLAEGGEGGEGGGALPPGAIQVTPEEAEAIGRLEALGFPRHMAIQAYIACDKNEEIAANYLFEHGFEDDDDDEAPAA